MSRSLPIVALLFVFVGCSGPPAAPENPDFVLPETGSVQPWTNDSFDAGEDKYTFAVHSDLTGGEREGIYEVAIAQLSLLRPEFIINVGDLIEGGTEDVANINAQWDSFDERAQSRPNRPGDAGRMAGPVGSGLLPLSLQGHALPGT